MDGATAPALPAPTLGYSVPMSRHTSKLARLTRGRLALPKKRSVTIGAVPGMSHEDLAKDAASVDVSAPAAVHIIEYGKSQHETRSSITDLAEVLARPRAEGADIRWVDIVGLHDKQALAELAKAYDLHPLAMEDVVHTTQRPKAESYGDPEPGKPRFFIVARMLHRDEDGTLVHEQVSMFLGRHTVVTLQERAGDVWGNIRERIANPAGRFRTHGTGYLAYALLDAIVDALFPILETYADRLEVIEEKILTAPDESIIHEVHQLKRELMLIRREVWPMREMIRSLLDQDAELFDEPTRLFLRDVGDHAIAAVELIETYRDLASGLSEAWMTAMSNRMNEVMKVLTIVASMFIPISFLAGVFGMNFTTMPLLDHPSGFWLFAGACLACVTGMWLWFRRQGWL